MSWQFYSARDDFDKYRGLWNELNKICGNHILLDAAFVRELIRYFAPKETLLGIEDNQSNPAMAVVKKARIGFWQTFQPSQAPIGLFLLPKSDAGEQQVAALLRRLPGLCLGFALTQQDPDFTSFRELPKCRTIEIVDYINTPKITLTGTFENYWSNRGRDLTRNIARRLRRATEDGIQFELVTIRDVERVARCIQEYAALEAVGWKGKQGTAVTAQNAQGLFYRQILEKFCERGEGVVYQLSMDGKVVASDLCVERNGMLVVLKVTYDETVRNVSPSFLLRKMVLENLFRAGKIRTVEFYGRVRDWHTKWTHEVRTMYHINFYRDLWVPAMRHFVKSGTRFVLKTKLNESSYPRGES